VSAGGGAPLQRGAVRIVVAGVGNVLHQDDGFGIAVLKALAAGPPLPPGVELLEVGIGGMVLVQALEAPCDLLVIVDAVQRGGTPGTLYTLEPEVPAPQQMTLHESRDFFADTHYATPLRALTLARAIGRLPRVIRIVGCEAQEADEMGIGLNPPVAAAVEVACDRVRTLVHTADELGLVARHRPE